MAVQIPTNHWRPTPRFGTRIKCGTKTHTKTHTATHKRKLVCSSQRKESITIANPLPAMEKAHKAVDAVVDGVKNVAIGSEKKPKVKKEKGGDGGAEGPLGRSIETYK